MDILLPEELLLEKMYSVVDRESQVAPVFLFSGLRDFLRFLFFLISDEIYIFCYLKIIRLNHGW